MDEKKKIEKPKVERVYHDLGGGYYLSTDTYNFILSNKVKCNDDEIYRAVGFYGSIPQLYRAIVEKDIKENPEMFANIEAVTKLIDDRFEKLSKVSKDLKKLINKDEK